MRLPKNIHFLWLLLLLLFIGGCRADERRLFDEKGQILGQMVPKHFKAADSLLFAHLLDSVYQAISHKTAYDDWERYREYSAFWFVDVNDYIKALDYTDSMLAIFGPDSDPGPAQERYLSTLFTQGDILVAMERYDEAYYAYYEARTGFLKQGDSTGASQFTGRLAMVNFQKKRYAEAIVYFKQQLQEIGIRYKNREWLIFTSTQGVLDNIGIAFDRMGQLDSAEYYYRKALSYIEQNKMEFADNGENYILMAQAVIYGNLASVSIEQKEYAEAEELLLKSIFINLKPKRTPIDAAYSMLKLADVYMQTGKYAKIPPLYHQVDSLRHTIAATELTLRYLRSNGEYAMLTGQPAKAYQFLHDEIQMQDSLTASIQSSQVSDIRQAFEHIDTQQKLQNASRRKTEFLQIAIIFGLMLLVILLLLWRSYRRTQRNLNVLNVLHAEMHQKNEHLISTLEELEKVSHDKQKMTHVVVHDLRGPIGSIASVAQLYTEDDAVHDPKELREVLTMISASAQSALTLIKELMQSRKAAQQVQMVNETVEMQALLHYCITILQHRADEKYQQIILTGSEARIEGNREKLLRIFHNLLDNAIKFSPHHSHISIHVALLRSHVQVTVTDDGIGMPEEMQRTIDKERSLASRSGTDGEASFGLGLSIVYQLMEEHQGKIWFKSADGKGTTFYLEFPLY